jgi:hypothetical protein
MDNDEESNKFYAWKIYKLERELGLPSTLNYNDSTYTLRVISDFIAWTKITIGDNGGYCYGGLNSLVYGVGFDDADAPLLILGPSMSISM